MYFEMIKMTIMLRALSESQVPHQADHKALVISGALLEVRNPVKFGKDTVRSVGLHNLTPYNLKQNLRITQDAPH